MGGLSSSDVMVAARAASLHGRMYAPVPSLQLSLRPRAQHEGQRIHPGSQSIGCVLRQALSPNHVRATNPTEDPLRNFRDTGWCFPTDPFDTRACQPVKKHRCFASLPDHITPASIFPEPLHRITELFSQEHSNIKNLHLIQQFPEHWVSDTNRPPRPSLRAFKRSPRAKPPARLHRAFQHTPDLNLLERLSGGNMYGTVNSGPPASRLDGRMGGASVCVPKKPSLNFEFESTSLANAKKTHLHRLEPLYRDHPELVDDKTRFLRRKGEREVVPRDLIRKRLHKVLSVHTPDQRDNKRD